MIIGKIQGERSAQASFVENNHMIQAFAPKGTNQPLDIGPLPRRSRGREHFLNLHILQDMEPVAEEVLQFHRGTGAESRPKNREQDGHNAHGKRIAGRRVTSIISK